MDTGARLAVAEALSPQERLLPSEWSERHRVLKEGQTEQPGPWRNDFWPWQPAIMDVLVQEPEKQGVIQQKGAQLGGSDGWISVIGWIVDQRPGPILYLISTDDLARRFGLHRFEYMIESSPVLRGKFKRGKQHHETILQKEFHGGLLVIAGSQSPNKLMSDPYQYIFTDEVDRLPIFPGLGSAWDLAAARKLSFTRGFEIGWSTPTIENFGISLKYTGLSDMRRYFVACPHCEAEQWLKFSQVQIDEDPLKSVYECEGCKRPISDVARVAAIYNATFRTTLTEAEARQRPFAGFAISHLYNPRMPLAALVRKWQNCQNEDDRQVFYNTILGEPYVRSTSPITQKDMERLAVGEPKTGAPADTMFLTVGIDVQSQDWFYVDISGWLPSRMKWLGVYARVQGWERLEAVIRGYEVKAGERTLKVRGGAIDAGWKTTEVYEFCKKMGLGFLLPTVYHTTPPGETWKPRQVWTAGGIVRYELDRFYWMDRVLARFSGDEATAGVMLPRGISDEYVRHILANVRVMRVTRFGREAPTWVLPQGRSDDYLQAGVNAEFAAMQLGLDRFSEEVKPVKAARSAAYKKAQKEKREKEPWIDAKRFDRLRGGRFWG